MKQAANQSIRRPLRDLRTSVEGLKAKCEVRNRQLLHTKVSAACQQSEVRKKTVEWIYDRCVELGTTARTPQLAGNLVDLFHAKEPDLDQDNMYALGAAALMISIKIVEALDISQAFVQQLPGVQVSASSLAGLERGLLSVSEWTVDSPTATDIVDALSQYFPEVQYAQRVQLDTFLGFAYRSGVVRVGPLILALVGLQHLIESQDAGIKLCLELAGVTEAEAESLYAEVQSIETTLETASDLDSTYSSSPKSGR